jgi:hypothetical protein
VLCHRWRPAVAPSPLPQLFVPYMQLGVASTEFVTEDRNAVKAMLDVLARMVQRHPGWLLAAVAVATGGLGFFAAQQEADVDITAFAPDTELANAFDRVQNDFAAGGGAVQVILDAGPDGDVVSPEGVRAAVRVQQAVAGDAEVADGLAEGTPQAPAVVSFASPILGALQEQGLNVTEVAGEQLDQLAAQVLGSEQGAQLAGLLSRDRDVPAADARGGIVLVRLDPGLTQVEEQQVGTAVRDLCRSWSCRVASRRCRSARGSCSQSSRAGSRSSCRSCWG